MISSITEASVSSKYHHLSKGVKVMLKLSLISIFMKSFENCVEYSPATVTFPSPSFSRPLYLMPVWLPSQKFLVKVISSSAWRPSQVNSLSWLSLWPKLERLVRSLPLPSHSPTSSSTFSTSSKNSVFPKLRGASYQPENWSPTFSCMQSERSETNTNNPLIKNLWDVQFKNHRLTVHGGLMRLLR